MQSTNNLKIILTQQSKINLKYSKATGQIMGKQGIRLRRNIMLRCVYFYLQQHVPQ